LYAGALAHHALVAARRQAVISAFVTTVGVVACLLVIAFFTPLDATSWGPILGILTMAFIITLFLGLFWINSVVILVNSCDAVCHRQRVDIAHARRDVLAMEMHGSAVLGRLLA
jgi:FtsH-binding integral membrane protein